MTFGSFFFLLSLPQSDFIYFHRVLELKETVAIALAMPIVSDEDV